MLPKPNRLQFERDFARLFKSGRGFSGKYLTLKVILNKQPASRIGFVISTKISKKATIRNLIKRRMREIIRLRLYNMKAGYDLAFIAKPLAAKADFEQLAAEMSILLGNSGLTN